MASTAHKILLVDDEPDILEFLKYSLEKEGYSVNTADNGNDAIELALNTVPDLILLDVMMPEMDGMETCTKLREKKELGNTLIAFLTARGEDYSQIAGFSAGADDYIAKPIKPKVLISRIKALLRRNAATAEAATVLQPNGSLKIDTERYIVIKKGKELNLPKKEFELLNLLVSKPGKVFTRDVILSEIWGHDIVVGNRTIDVHIRKLREKIGDDLIHTVKGVGYKFIGAEA